MKKRSEMEKKVSLSNISQPVETKASAKIVNHPFQYMTFKDTQMIKEAYINKRQECFNPVSHSKLNNSENNIENCGNIVKMITISERNATHKKKWKYNKRQCALGCILGHDVVLPTKDRLQLVNGNKNNTHEEIALNNKIYESSKKESVPREDHVQNTSVIGDACYLMLTSESSIKENLSRDKNEVPIVSMTTASFPEKSERTLSESDTDDSKMVENKKVLKTRIHNDEHALVLPSSSKYSQKSINEPNTTVTDDIASGNNKKKNEQNETRIHNGSRVQTDLLKPLCKLRQALVCKSQNSKEEKTEKCFEKSETEKDVDVRSSNPIVCDTENIEAHCYIVNPPLTSKIETSTEKSEARYKKLRMKTLKKRKDRVEIRNKVNFSNISISDRRSRQDEERIKEKFVDSADDSGIPSSDLKLQKEKVQMEKRNYLNLCVDDIRQIIPKKKLQREVEDLMAQEDYISNVSGYDVSFLNGQSNRRSTEEEIVTFILKKYVKNFKRESNIAKSPVPEKVCTKELSSPAENPITTLKAQSLSSRDLKKINYECIQPERSGRRQTVKTKEKIGDIITKEENIFTGNEGNRRRVNESLTEERVISEDENTKKKIKQRRKSLLAEAFNENMSLEDASFTEQEAVSKETIKFNNVSVNIPWEVPPLHRIETCVTRTPLRDQQKQIKDLNVEIKKGAFDKMEDNKIKENWREFCALHKLPSNPTLFISGTTVEKIASLSHTQKLQLVRFLAHGLENRLLHSVYMRFQRLFLKRKSGRFSREEDEIIMDYMKTRKSNQQFLDLGRILGRDKLAVEKRYICIKNKQSSIKINKWDEKAITKFLINLLEIAKCRQIERLKTREIKSTEWLELSQKLNIPTNKLQRVWRYTIYPRLFIEHSVNSKPIKRNLVDLLWDSNECDWRRLNWNRIAEKFKGFTGEKLYLMFKNMVNYHVPSAIQGNLRECLEYLQQLDFQTCMYPCKEIKKIQVVQAS